MRLRVPATSLCLWMQDIPAGYLQGLKLVVIKVTQVDFSQESWQCSQTRGRPSGASYFTASIDLGQGRGRVGKGIALGAD